jgi:hypothetical protein
VFVRHEHRRLAEFLEPGDQLQHLILTAAPGAGRIDVNRSD